MARARALAKTKYEHGQSAVDTSTPIHFALGLAAGLIGITPITAALLLTVGKIGVAAAEKNMKHALFTRAKGESNMNELCDLLFEIAGVDIGARLRALSSVRSS